MKDQVKQFNQFLKESMGESTVNQAAIIFNPINGNLEVMFGNSFMYDHHGLEDAVDEGNEVYIVEYDPQDAYFYAADGKLDLSGVNVLKDFQKR
jgi:hypothetical protein